ncbi:MAG: phosphomannomutase/phosphoglucomutase [Pseudomonadota bacterium]
MAVGPVAKRRFKRRTVRNFIIGGSALLVIGVFGGGGWYFYTSMAASAEKEAIEAKERQARDFATSIQTNYKNIIQPVKDLAKDKELVTLFLDGDEQALSSAAELKQETIPDMLKLRLLIPGNYELDTESNPPLGYASLDLLRKAETTAQVNAEVLLKGSEQEHVLVIERVLNQALELIGLVHASLSVSVLDDLVKGIESQDAYIEVVQRSAGKKILLAGAGNTSVKQGEGTSTSISDTNWVILYWSESAAGSATDAAFSLPIIPIAVVLLVLLAAGLFVLKRRSAETVTASSTIESSTTYEGAVRAIVDGAHGSVKKWIPNLPKGDGNSSSSKTNISQGLSGDDITTIAKPAMAQPSTEQKSATKKTKPKPKSTADVTEPPAEESKPEAAKLDPVIFRTYDIRGIVDDTLTVEGVNQIAKALGTYAKEKNQTTFTVGKDGRGSGPKLAEALIDGLKSTGMNVIDIGMVPTPVLYFSTYQLKTNNGVMLTGSHNPPEYNGLKMMVGGITLSGDDIQQLKQIIETGEFAKGKGEGSSYEVNADYIRRITDDIPVALGASLKIVVDCGNGVAGVLAPQLLNAIGHDVIEMYCDVDGRFPNHHPDPSQPENMQDLIEKVKAENADIGFAFDGDGDRLGIVDANGSIIWPDRQMMLLAKDVLSRNAGAPIIYDVKCSRYLKAVIEASGGKPLMWKTGHSLIKSKMKEVEAPLAGEMSGHIFFKERWYGFDDALYTAARFIEIFTNAKRKPSEMFDELPDGVSTPELRLPMPESEHGSFMVTLIQVLENSPGGEVSDIDGVRIEYEDGWGLARPSNTSPNIVMRFEGENEAALQRIQGVFKDAVLSVKSDAELPY